MYVAVASYMINYLAICCYQDTLVHLAMYMYYANKMPWIILIVDTCIVDIYIYL